MVAFGDSLTYGYGVLKGIEYPCRLEKHFTNLNLKVINKGINGNTTREALARLEEDVLSYSPEIVIFLFGSNDCSLSEDYYRPLIEYEKNITCMIKTLQSFSHTSTFNQGVILPIFITPPPAVDTDFFPFTTNDRLELYAQSVKALAEKNNCPIIDFFTILSNKKEEAYEDFFQFDGIHLSDLGYDLLFKTVVEFFENFIKTSITD